MLIKAIRIIAAATARAGAEGRDDRDDGWARGRRATHCLMPLGDERLVDHGRPGSPRPFGPYG